MFDKEPENYENIHSGKSYNANNFTPTLETHKASQQLEQQKISVDASKKQSTLLV